MKPFASDCTYNASHPYGAKYGATLPYRHSFPLPPRRLHLVPLLQDLAGGARALDARLDEFSRQSFLAREMVEQAALRWEQQHWVGRLVRPEEFPLLHFLRTGVQGSGDAGEVQQAPLPELVREELLHRFVTGEYIVRFIAGAVYMLLRVSQCDVPDREAFRS